MARTPHGRSLCLACGRLDAAAAGMCAACGSADVAPVADGALVGFPAGHQACERCGALDRPLLFRGSIRLYAVILFARESRVAGYLCAECAARQTAASLAFTGLLGWWGFLSALLWAPRATYHNWRAVRRHPRRPLAWGALEAEAFAEAVRPARGDDGWSAFGATDAAPEWEPAR